MPDNETELAVPESASVSRDDARGIITLTLRFRPESLKTINFPMSTRYAEHLIQDLQECVDAQKQRQRVE